jgi:large subunit ribosomal protein L10
MPKTRQQKERVLTDLTENLKNAKSAALASFSAVPVSKDQELRSNMKKESISYSVVKKTLLRKAFDKIGYSTDPLNSLSGNISMAISADDEVAPAKALADFAKDNEGMSLVGGVLENNWVDENKVKALAALPSKDELIAKTVGTIKAPLNGFVNVLAGNIRGFVNVLNGIKESKS